MRKRATWKTTEEYKMYSFQMNEYEETRILLLGKVFRTFHGQNARRDARETWNTIKAANA